MDTRRPVFNTVPEVEEDTRGPVLKTVPKVDKNSRRQLFPR